MTMALNQTTYSCAAHDGLTMVLKPREKSVFARMLEIPSAAIGKMIELMIKAADVIDQRWMKRALQPVKEGA